MKKKETFCAVVVTYNRKNMLLECLDSLLKQTHPLDAIYLIDNASTDGTPELLKEKRLIEAILTPGMGSLETEFEAIIGGNRKIKIHYVRMQKNTGGAGGFYEGVRRGYGKGYDWLWLMDDDCLLDHNALKEQVSLTNKTMVSTPQKLVRGSTKPVSTFRNQSSFPLVYEIKYTLAFNGFLISREIVQNVGLPRTEFFIDRDDWEYCFRLKSKNYTLAIISAAKLFHPDDPILEVKFGKFTIIKIINYPNTPRRIYYRVRNSIWTCRLYPKEELSLVLIKGLIKLLLVLIIKFNIKGLEFYLKGLIDGMLSRLEDPINMKTLRLQIVKC